jgi:hypothetical protein
MAKPKRQYRLIVFYIGEEVDTVFIAIPMELYDLLHRVRDLLGEKGFNSKDLEELGVVPLYIDFTVKDSNPIRVASINESWCHPEFLPVTAEELESMLEDDVWMDVSMTGGELDKFIEPNRFSVMEDVVFSVQIDTGVVTVWVRVAGEFFPVPIDPPEIRRR